MNKRIEELINQSYLNVQSQSGRDITYFDKEKFAELIVRDIVNGMRVHAKALEGTGSDNVVFVLRTHASGIEQHFGVEE